MRIAKCMFEPERQETIAPEQGGRLVTVDLGPPLWRASYATTPPSEIEYDLWRAWVASLKGAAKLFYGEDVRRRLPRAYRKTGFAELTRAVSGGAFDGTSSAWEVNPAFDEITVGGASGQQLPVGFEIHIGDYLDLRWETSKRSLHRMLTAQNADASGVGTWTVEPPIPQWMPEEAVVNFLRPNCTMVVVPGSAALDAEGKSRTVAFDAKQHLEP